MQRVFNKMPSEMRLPGHAIHGHGKEALQHFERMCEEGVQPDDTTFMCLL